MITKKLYHYAAMTVLTVFSVMVLLAAEACAFVNYVILDEAIYSEAIGRYGVAEAAYDQLVEYFTQYEAPTGIPAEVFTDAISEEDIIAASYRLTVDSVDYLSGRADSQPEITYDFTELEESVRNYIEEYSEENDIEKDSDYYELIDNTIAVSEAQISGRLDAMMLYTLSTSTAGSSLNGLLPYVKPAMFGLAAVFALLVVLMFIINRNHLRDMPYWCGSIMFCSSAAILIPVIYLKKTAYFDSFIISTEHIYKAITGLANSCLEHIISAQSTVMIIGVVLIVSTLIIHSLYVRYRQKLHERKKQSGI